MFRFGARACLAAERSRAPSYSLRRETKRLCTQHSYASQGEGALGPGSAAVHESGNGYAAISPLRLTAVVIVAICTAIELISLRHYIFSKDDKPAHVYGGHQPSVKELAENIDKHETTSTAKKE